jgi:putative ABC transport system permease protein
MTSLSIGLVVWIFVFIMSLAVGIESALVSTGSELNVLVRRKASDSELSSSVSKEALQYIKYLPGVAQGADGNPIGSAEVITLVNLPKHGQEQGSNVTIRGLGPAGLALRPQVKLVEGRMFTPGLREAVVSRAIAQRFQNTGLGGRLEFGKGDWAVVGLFDGGNTAFDSEIWVDVNQLADDFNRQNYSSVLLKATDAAAVAEIRKRIEEDQRYNLSSQTEASYYAEQTQSAGMIKVIAYFIAFVMGVGACFAAMNAMYAAVAYRSREIATLLIIGFRRFSIIFSFLVESVLLALAGGVIGCLATFPINGLATGTANWQTFSEIAFSFRVSPMLIVAALIFSVAMGLFGGFLPSVRAGLQSPAATMRES